MRNLIVTAQLIVLTVIAISIMREIKHADAARDFRTKALQALLEIEQIKKSDDCEIYLPPIPPPKYQGPVIGCTDEQGHAYAGACPPSAPTT